MVRRIAASTPLTRGIDTGSESGPRFPTKANPVDSPERGIESAFSVVRRSEDVCRTAARQPLICRLAAGDESGPGPLRAQLRPPQRPRHQPLESDGDAALSARPGLTGYLAQRDEEFALA